MIYDFKDLSSKMNWSKSSMRKNKIQTSTVPISKIKQVSDLKENKNQLYYKITFDMEYQTLITRKEKTHVNVAKYVPRRAYDSCQGLPAAKIMNIIILSRKRIPFSMMKIRVTKKFPIVSSSLKKDYFFYKKKLIILMDFLLIY